MLRKKSLTVMLLAIIFVCIGCGIDKSTPGDEESVVNITKDTEIVTDSKNARVDLSITEEDVNNIIYEQQGLLLEELQQVLKSVEVNKNTDFGSYISQLDYHPILNEMEKYRDEFYYPMLYLYLGNAGFSAIGMSETEAQDYFWSLDYEDQAKVLTNLISIYRVDEYNDTDYNYYIVDGALSADVADTEQRYIPVFVRMTFFAKRK